MPINKAIADKLKKKDGIVSEAERVKRKNALIRFGMKNKDADSVVIGATHREHLAAAIAYCKTLKKT